MRTTMAALATATLLALPPISLAQSAAASTTPAPAAASCSQSYLPLPDPACQPGATNPDVTQATIHQTICVGGYSSSIRPPSSYTTALKKQQIAEYGYSDTDLADYEEDHMINLSLGGAPRDPKNLWPEPRYEAGGSTAADKDDVEFKLYRAVCDDKVQLVPAQLAIAKNWRTALHDLGLE
ncbi:hypothetical protein J4573_31395 [Actinomadura barringtoniae]|uniref:DUF3558 domain-containing protein n=1 Tax=Actinomadura barringtoniae TaxID=1427535 RepID=A0A939PF00_9ACTN|nr:hypothetical protein [Actinomadura barringtoniae]MBO2451632.1 hypothetical protein [Actinomadura barringtoniae]